MSQILEITSLEQLHRLLEIEPPLNPLISVVRHQVGMNLNFAKTMRVNNHLYFISLKANIQGSFHYGRQSYDFQAGSLVFMRPGQVAAIDSDLEPDIGGWSIFFHPDLLFNQPLSETIRQYTFFDYAITEALHVSDREKKSLEDQVNKIEFEIHQHIDSYTHSIIVHHLESILKYSQRYFNRQFITRHPQNFEILTKFESYLQDYFESDAPSNKGIPTVRMCGEAMNMSGKYLGDLLKKETGKTLKETISLFMLERAKLLLLNSNDSIGEIAFRMGFEYPQHFSQFFKKTAGISPKDFRLNTKG